MTQDNGPKPDAWGLPASKPDWNTARRETKLLCLLLDKLHDKGILTDTDIDDLLYGTVIDRPPEKESHPGHRRQ